MAKVLLVGEGRRGKTEWCRSVASYVPTQGVEVDPLRWYDQIVKVWDCAGVAKYGGLRDGYYIGANAVIVFADNETEALFWLNEVARVIPNINFIVLTRSENLSNFTTIPVYDKSLLTRNQIFDLLLA